jgi:hypothetical protein
MFWPVAKTDSYFAQGLGNFYGVWQTGMPTSVSPNDSGSVASYFYSIFCENVSGVNNTCPWLGPAKPALPSVSS